jgi:glycerol-3-phosphate dehydrogenase
MAYKMKGFPEHSGVSPLKKGKKRPVIESLKEKDVRSLEREADSLQRAANEILISNKPNPNREADVKKASDKMEAKSKQATKARKYNISLKKYKDKLRKITPQKKSTGKVYKTKSIEQDKRRPLYGKA